MNALDISPNSAQLFDDPFIPAVDVIHAINKRLAAGHQARQHQPRTCAQVRGWCWRAWWPAARRLLIACITSTAGMKGSSKSCALLGLISSAFMPPAHDTAANALLTPGRSYRYFALREGRVRWSNGGRMFQEGMR